MASSFVYLYIQARVALEEARRLGKGEGVESLIASVINKLASTMLNRLVSRFSTTVER